MSNPVTKDGDGYLTFTTKAGCNYFNFFVTNTATYGDNICLYINYDTPGLPYEAYEQQTITLPNIELRSLGDVYDVAYQTGGGKRRIGYRDYESGDESDSNVLTDGTHTIYVLAQETDITKVENPGWTELVKVNNFGTLEFTADPAQNPQIPQAYFILYTVNLVEFLDSLYVEAGGDPGGLAPVKSVSINGTALMPSESGNVDISIPSSVSESYTITTWTALSSSSPFTYQATVTATHTIGNDTEVELINDNAVLFATYGFAIGSISGQNVTIYSIGEPSSNVTLEVIYRG